MSWRKQTHFGSVEDCRKWLNTVTCDPIQDRTVIDPSVVNKVFKKLHTMKARGPNGIPALLLKTFTDELAQFGAQFQLSVATYTLIYTSPTKCKKTAVISDFRPALTL